METSAYGSFLISRRHDTFLALWGIFIRQNDFQNAGEKGGS
jgi:hypothetical protein